VRGRAKPSSYKDLEDMTIRSIFPEELETELARLLWSISCSPNSI
jgi:hypothetical protein